MPVDSPPGDTQCPPITVLVLVINTHYYYRRMYARPCPGNQVFCICQPWTRDARNKNDASAYGMGAGGLAVDAMVIGCLGVDRRGRRFFVLSHFVQV